MEKLFPSDVLSKRERVERTLSHQSVDRAALHEQLSYNTAVISLYTGRSFADFSFAAEDFGLVVRGTLDSCFPFIADKGTGAVIDDEGFAFQNERWMSWRTGRPFSDEEGAAAWIRGRIAAMEESGFNRHTAVAVGGDISPSGASRFHPDEERRQYRQYMGDLQHLVGETVIIDFSFTGFCDLFDAMGLEIFSFFAREYPDLLEAYMGISMENEINRVRAVADPALSPVILIPEDFSTRQGPIFREDFLDRHHYPHVKRLTEAWHARGLKVLYHSDGNYRKAVPALLACGVDGFYCLEPNCGMDVVELKRTWPGAVWSGGVNGVDVMELGSPEDVKREVARQIRETRALEEGGLLVASSSEINPPIPAENFKAMVDAVGEWVNHSFKRDGDGPRYPRGLPREGLGQAGGP